MAKHKALTWGGGGVRDKGCGDYVIMGPECSEA